MSATAGLAPDGTRPAPFAPDVAVVIPAWKPDASLIGLIGALVERGCRAIVLVDDGSGADYQPVFERTCLWPAVRMLRHKTNCGKGCALKTGLRAFLAELPAYTGAVTADADGQHTVDDIARVAAAAAIADRSLVLGARRFDPEMPFRSRFGNVLTRHVFRSLTGTKLADTQTGLRGLPRAIVPELLALRGERYEYEMNVLAHWCRAHGAPVEVPIQTVYTEGNRSSHFHPVRDSAQIYGVLARFYLRRWFTARRDTGAIRPTRDYSGQV